MYKKAILGSASGASGHHAAKPFGLGRRVDGTLVRRKLVFLSGEASLSSVGGLNLPRCRRNLAGNGMVVCEDSAEDIVVR